MRPGGQVQLVAIYVGAAELLVVGDRGWSTSRASTSTATSASARQRMHGPATCATKRIRTAYPAAVRERSRRVGTDPAGDHVALAGELERPGVGVELEAAALPGTKRETREVDAVISRAHPVIEVSERTNRKGPDR